MCASTFASPVDIPAHTWFLCLFPFHQGSHAISQLQSAAKLVFDETGSVRAKVGHSSLHQRRLQAIEKEHGPVKMEVDSDK
jgi:hypothetical protein